MLSGEPPLLMGFEPSRLPFVGVCCGFPGELKRIDGPEGARDADDHAGIGGGWEISEKFGGGKSGARIDGVGRDFGERDEDEGTLGEARMRDFEVELREDEVAVEEQI
jgi:hypothetical protein